jgi:hypothetical protein
MTPRPDLHAVVPFPPRDAGRVLAEAMAAAEQAAIEEAARRAHDLRSPWGGDRLGERCDAPVLVAQAALNAAAPLLRNLTSDPRMVEIVAAGMAEEAMIRLRKRGAA